MTYVSVEEKNFIEKWLADDGPVGPVGEGKQTSRQINANVFGKYGVGCEYFIETGTYIGGGIYKAISTGQFSKFFSVELNPDRQSENKSRFDYRQDVDLYTGYSTDGLKLILPKIDKRSFFYLDAHAEGGGVPTYEELDMIKGMCDRNDHTILVDDVPLYFGDGQALKSKLMWVNPKYTIEMLTTIHKDYQMIAYIKED
jgi:hypothetical protein